MATRKKAKYPRVHAKHGAWYWIEPRAGKWIRLCAIDEGETKLVDRLSEERKKQERPEGSGDMRPLIDIYVRTHAHQHREKAWPKYGEYAGNGFRNVDVKNVRPAHVSHWLKVKYAEKLPMQRVMRAFLSGFFQWCVETNRISVNPCREVKLKKPKPNATYITDAHFAAIRSAMDSYTAERADGKLIERRIGKGALMQCFVDLCYLTVQRSTEIRMLKWSQVDRQAGVIHFLPSKTEDSSGIAVDFAISPEIAAVLDRIKELNGGVQYIGDSPVFRTVDTRGRAKPYEATSIRSAWRRACVRAKLTDEGYTIKMIRAKALTDAAKAGYDIKALQEAAAHSTPAMTEDYIKRRDVPVSGVRLHVPTAKMA
ncbi:site-specific integrase [Pararobbsia silviterrae]|uniref:Integrase n=1 Tax=Pararobbsia silviterrae TaxID=1792498 RepID=A0A494Y4H7_9BURK|nr:tyrosine-type recombinase/integrase [Pararobbsia silviterrae]RKP56403.1 integrase [Pararobbsia silviterrae]